MSITVVSLNVGRLATIPWAERKTRTGIFKQPVEGPIRIEAGGLVGDQIGNLKYHGGPDQAVYLYSVEDYAWWEEELGCRLAPGTFGENLTVRHADPRSPRVGERWQLGSVVLELSGPRIPCATLAQRLDDPSFVKRFARANRGGWYARVLQAGVVEATAEVAVTAAPPEHPTIDELFALWHSRNKAPELLARAARSPVAERYRKKLMTWFGRSLSSPA